jgi:hypothetical protein
MLANIAPAKVDVAGIWMFAPSLVVESKNVLLNGE